MGSLEANTKESGIAHFLILEKAKPAIGEPRFTAVCLDFDIVESGDNQAALTESVLEAAKLHLQTVAEQNLSDDLLNRHAPQEYWDLYYSCLASELEKEYHLKQQEKAQKEISEDVSVSGVFKYKNKDLIAAAF